MSIDWGLVCSYALGSVIASAIGSLFAVGFAVLLRRWLRGNQVLAGLAQLPAALTQARMATPAETSAVASALREDDLAALGCTLEHPCGLPGCPGPAQSTDGR